MTKIIGILNYNANSFSDGGMYNRVDTAIAKMESLFQQGADIVDIGASATSYGANLLSEDQEIKILACLLNQIDCKNISIDTYHYSTMKYAIDLGVSYINDVTGGKDKRILELMAANPQVNYICMYSLVLPADRDIRIKSVDEIYNWIANKIAECIKYGILNERIIIDPGIGFVTNVNQSLEVIRNVEELKKFGVKICIGHSRKSFFGAMTNQPPQDRDIETTAASVYMLSKKVDYVRVHNVEMHKRAFKVFANLLS
ncbi:dihydropteroate synthase [Candidatus Bandiella euplotis]|uniref:dihydropteroate synthase n=1 Tax=Candidatus Bandiella euplotis TaxID=1664265 RepID=A0ABZ0UL08_9RICK|nr:dihydropteroate synthase [Candidatus Bandiella woodruffii]WPX96833.1 Dihydropteroate synthase [Candidatus Bandiella woodruffii]